jgi:hypothetical protein
MIVITRLVTEGSAQRVAWIKAQLAAGRIVQLTTYTKATSYDARHADMFKATKAGAFVRRGKSWDCIDFTNLQSFGPSTTWSVA